MFDTHCHLNFKAFKKNLPDVVARAKQAGVTHIVIPGTDVKTSTRAVEIAAMDVHFYAAVGIHPHHAYKIITQTAQTLSSPKAAGTRTRAEIIAHITDAHLAEIESLVTQQHVVAIGEVGMDRHEYQETVYGDYAVNEEFIAIQKILFKRQIELAIRYKKSLIIHNREAKHDLLPILEESWNDSLRGRSVFHCCEPDADILSFVIHHEIYIGVDGDLTYSPEKQEFVKKIPPEKLVIETDSPFLLPEPLRSQKRYPNEPAHIQIVAETIAKLRKISVSEVMRQTLYNGKHLFQLPHENMRT